MPAEKMHADDSPRCYRWPSLSRSYQSTNPVLAGIARHAIDEALADHASTFH